MIARRVLHCIPGMGGGGAERQLSYLAEGLTRLGWDVHVALVSGGPNFERLRRSGATIHRLEARNNHDPRLLRQLLRVIHRIQPDLLQLWLLQMEILGSLAAGITGLPWILSERCSEEAYPRTLKYRLRMVAGRRAAAVVSNSTGGDLYWRPRLPARVPRYIIPNALPIEEIERAAATPAAELGVPADSRLVLFAGRLAPQKDPETLLRALVPILSLAPICAVLAGEGPLRERLVTLARELAIDQHVHVRGFIPSVWSVMKSASVFVSPSLYDGHPNTVLEAMACGLPLVVSDIPPHRAFLDEQKAVFFPPGSRDRLTEGILRVLADPEGATARSRRAAATARQLSTDRMAQAYARAYLEILEGRHESGQGSHYAAS